MIQKNDRNAAKGNRLLILFEFLKASSGRRSMASVELCLCGGELNACSPWRHKRVRHLPRVHTVTQLVTQSFFLSTHPATPHTTS